MSPFPKLVQVINERFKMLLTCQKWLWEAAVCDLQPGYIFWPSAEVSSSLLPGLGHIHQSPPHQSGFHEEASVDHQKRLLITKRILKTKTETLLHTKDRKVLVGLRDCTSVYFSVCCHLTHNVYLQLCGLTIKLSLVDLTLYPNNIWTQEASFCKVRLWRILKS